MSNKQLAAIIAVVLIIGSPYAVREWVSGAQQIDRYETAKQRGLARCSGAQCTSNRRWRYPHGVWLRAVLPSSGRLLL
jgi:hypothetical protein